MQVHLFLTILAGILMLLVAVIWAAELQSTVAFVLDKGGLWLSYSTGIGRLRLVGFQIRLMSGHKPRAWIREPLLRRYVPAEFDQTVRSVKSEKWKPLQVPLRSAFDIGIKVIIRELNVKATLGIDGDAAATALLCGGITTILQVLRIISTRGEFLPKGKIVIYPEFNRERLSIRFKCILAIKVRHIIREVIESHARRKNNGQSSNRNYNANHDGKHTQHG